MVTRSAGAISNAVASAIVKKPRNRRQPIQYLCRVALPNREPGASLKGSSFRVASCQKRVSAAGQRAKGKCSLGRGPGIILLLRILQSFRTSAHAFGSCLPQPGDEVSMRPPGPSRVDPGVEPCGGLRIFVAEELPKRFVGPGISVEVDFRRYVPELVTCQLDTDMSEHALLDSQPDRPESSRLAFAGNEQGVWAPADHCRRNLIAKRIEPV